MKHLDVIVRPATKADAADILEIYGWYIKNTAITFEYEIPTVEAFAARIEGVLERYPYLVAVDAERILGYAYAAPYIRRSACDWSCEVSIYLAPHATKQGLGRQLYQFLERCLYDMGIVNMYASIACTDGEDPYVDSNSADFHAHMGFRKIGTFLNCGYKFGRWYHLMWVEKTLRIHGENMKPINPFSKGKTV